MRRLSERRKKKEGRKKEKKKKKKKVPGDEPRGGEGDYPRMRTATLLSLSLFSIFANACDSAPEDLLYEEKCEETVTVLGLDEVSALGFSAAEILAIAEGSHEAPLFWHDGVITVGPESGEHSLVVDVAYSGGEIRLVDSKPEFGPDEEGRCAPRLEIDAEIGLHSDGGAIAETFKTTLEAVRPEVAMLSLELELDAVEGSLEVLATDPEEGKAGPINIGIGISSFGIFGSLDGVLEVISGEFASATLHNYATFPSDDLGCDFPFEAPLPFEAAWGGHSVMDALALMNVSPELILQWGGEFSEPDEPTPLLIEVAPTGTTACGRIAPGQALSFPVEVTMKSDDGRLAGAIELEATTTVDAEGELATLEIQRSDYYAGLASKAEFEERFGIHGVELGEYDEWGITFGMTASAEGIFGEITVLGGIVHECTEPEAPCEGTELFELTGGTWAPAS